MAKKCSDGTNLAMAREKYQCGVNSIMNDKSLRGPEGRLKLVAKMKDHIKIQEMMAKKMGIKAVNKLPQDEEWRQEKIKEEARKYREEEQERQEMDNALMKIRHNGEDGMLLDGGAFDHGNMKRITERITGLKSDHDAFRTNIPKEVDIMLTGFPCFGYSIMNERISLSKEQNWKYREQAAKVIIPNRPNAIIAEQVWSAESEADMRKLRRELDDEYVTFPKVINASDHGDATKRMRMWTIGFRKDVYETAGVEFKWPEGKFTNKKAQLDRMVDKSNDPGIEVAVHMTYTPATGVFIRALVGAHGVQVQPFQCLW